MTVKSTDTCGSPHYSLAGTRVLVVDDESTIRTILRQCLENDGFTVTEASSGEAALQSLGKHQFDIMVLDILMPDMPGMEVLRVVRQEYSKSQLPVIMVTVNEDSADIVAALSLGANDYITKPVTFAVLRARIVMHLAYRQAENALREASAVLEHRVEERTAELQATNKALEREISERKQVEKELERYKHIVNKTDDLMLFIDTDYICRSANQRYLDAHQKTWDAVVGRHVTDTIGADLFTTVVKMNYDRCLNGETFDFQYWRDYPGIGKRYMDINHSPHREDDGSVTGMIITMHDITERKFAEEALQQYKHIVDSTDDMIAFFDADHTYIAANQRYLDLHNKDSSEVIGKRIPDVIGTEFFECSPKGNIDRCLAGESINFQVWRDFPDSSQHYIDVNYSPHWQDDKTIAGVVITMRDITELKRAEEKILYLAYHDELTGLPSSRLGKDRLSSVIELARRNKTRAAVLYLDLDGFKAINDSEGHTAGDHVLNTVADRLRQSVRQSDTVARLGGDEFILVLGQIADETIPVKVAEKVIENLAPAIRVNGRDMSISASIGLALYPDHGDTADELINKADEAMYAAKRNGKNNYAIYKK